MNVEDWKNNEGEIVLRGLGIKEGQVILDFGCGEGVYSLIVSRIVGSTGQVFALDESSNKLSKLRDEISRCSIKNIEIIHASGEIDIPLENDFLDVILIYDVYHLLSEQQRERLIKEAARLLKNGGILSYHATHLSRYGVNLEEVHEKMKKVDLTHLTCHEKLMFHWQWIEEGTVINYYK